MRPKSPGNPEPGVSCLPGAGTFYAFPEVSGAIESLGAKDDAALAELILNEADVALVPGSAFGAPGYVRFSFACSLETLQEAIARIRRLLD